MYKYYTNQSGQLIVLATIILAVVATSAVLITAGSLTLKQNTRYSVDSVQAVSLAEAGIDKAVASLNATGGTYNGESETILGPGSFSVVITSIDASTKKVSATGYIPNKTKAKASKTVELLISKGVGIAFNYGAQVGEGGLVMQNNARIQGALGADGNVYSNGNILMSNGAMITGTAYVAGGTQPTADQQTECDSGSPGSCQDYEFGRNVGGENRLDIAQSFRPSQSAVLNKISLKLKKVGSPGNPTIRILGDNSGSPNKNNQLASATLNANLVTTQYGFVDVAFSPTPSLSAGTNYWIVIDTSSNPSNYWFWSRDSLGAYTNGNPKWSPNYSAGNPVWTNISGDLAFKAYMGGVATSIVGSNGSVISKKAYANTLQSLTIGQEAYYQVQSGITVNGSSCTSNPNCYPGSPDPGPQSLPVSDANIAEWQQAAFDGGTQIGDITSCPSTLAMKKYVGNVTLTNNCVSTIFTPIWITGNLILDNGSVMRLDSSYGPSSGVIVVDGTIKLSNNGRLEGSGAAGSFMMALSTFDSTQTDNTAIEADNGSSSMILYAGIGKIILKNNSTLKEVNGWKIHMDNNAIISYDSGLSGVFFSSGPGGQFSAIKGTYQLK